MNLTEYVVDLVRLYNDIFNKLGINLLL